LESYNAHGDQIPGYHRAVPNDPAVRNQHQLCGRVVTSQ